MTSTLNMKIYLKEILQIMDLFCSCSDSFHSSSYTFSLKVTSTENLEQSFTTPLSYYNQFTSEIYLKLMLDIFQTILTEISKRNFISKSNSRSHRSAFGLSAFPSLSTYRSCIIFYYAWVFLTRVNPRASEETISRVYFYFFSLFLSRSSGVLLSDNGGF